MLQVAVAALLHDIGKLYQRAHARRPPDGLPDATHAAYTAWFVERHAPLLERAGFVAAEVAQAATRHQRWRDRPEYQPRTPREWAVCLANTYASSAPLQGEHEADGNDAAAPLTSVFGSVALSTPAPSSGYDLAPLVEGASYPLLNAAERLPGDAYETRLVARLEARLRALSGLDLTPEALLANLTGALHEACWCVPVDTRTEPDVSLYDHLRLTAAIAVALWRYHEAHGDVTVAALQRESDAKFLLAVGDVGGVQEHIFRVRRARTGTGGLAKRLRARSLEVSLVTEALAASLLTGLELPALQRIMVAGGKFYALLPHTAQALEVLEQTRRTWEAWGLEQGGSLSVALAAVPVTASEFRAFDAVLTRAHAELMQAKLRPYASQLASPYLFAAVAGGAPRPCAVYDTLPAARDEPGAASLQAERDRLVGERLPKTTTLAWRSGASARQDAYRFPGAEVHLGPGGDRVLRGHLDFAVAATPWEVRPLLGHLPTVAHALALPRFAGSIDAYHAWLAREGLAEDDEDLAPRAERTLTFGEAAALATGAPALGALMLDADRLGETLQRGFARPGGSIASPSRVAGLSRLLEQFFASEVAALVREPQRYRTLLDHGPDEAWKTQHYPLIYSVYGGGDDLFLLGPWNVLLEFALDLATLFERFTGAHPDLTLSGGFVLSKPSQPVPLLAEAVQAAERRAKTAGRDRLALFGEVLTWREVRRARNLKEDLARALDDGAPRGFAHRLLDLHAMWRRWHEHGDPQGLRYKPMLYYLRRHEAIERHAALYEPLFDHTSIEMRSVPVWVQWALYESRGE